MIISEFFRMREDGVSLYKTYSDTDMMIKNAETGAMYCMAIDPESNDMNYIETDVPIEKDEDFPKIV